MTRKPHEVLEENVYIETEDGRLVPTTAILSAVTGGKQVRYIDQDGNILKTEKYSVSPYYKKD